MIAGWTVVLVALVYLCLLFAVAHYGDTNGQRWLRGPARSTIYALALAVYCTSWTFYGSVGLASRSGLDFLAVYVGPILLFAFGTGLITRVLRLAKNQNITSIADFVGSRYGKSQSVAALVCIVALIGTIPYIALQLKAISVSLRAILEVIDQNRIRESFPILGDLSLLVTLILTAFAIAFGTRHVDATEHQNGLVLAIAVESFVKLFAFLLVGFVVLFLIFGGWQDIARHFDNQPLSQIAEKSSSLGTFVTITVISACAGILLPRQFHMAVVENRDERDLRKAAYLFPLYLILINLFVIPLALAGLISLDSNLDRDMTVLKLPLVSGFGMVALVVFIGGLSAATAMVVVDSIAVSIMVSNDLAMPLILRNRLGSKAFSSKKANSERELGTLVLSIRRLSIFAIVMLGYVYYQLSADFALASIGLISFAAIAQIAPAFFGGLVWRRATARGAVIGLTLGLFFWAYLLLLPTLAPSVPALASLVDRGPFEIDWLRPATLFGFQTKGFVAGVFISILANILGFVLASLMRAPSPIERLQANIFVGPDGLPMREAFRVSRALVTMGELKAAVSRYLGTERTQSAFERFAIERGIRLEDTHEADIKALRHAEYLLASVIGAASSRLVLSLLLRRQNVSAREARSLLDDASAVLQYNRDILQNALDHAKQGITVFDSDMRLLCWNHEFAELFDLPLEMMRVGTALDDIIRFNATRGIYGKGDWETQSKDRMTSFMHDTEPVRLRLFAQPASPAGRVVEIRSAHLPDGGIVTTYTDVSESVMAEEALEAANESLERRVEERTEELTRVNAALARAKAEADEANQSKTRFLAAASHDILQPLNAARLYAASLLERDRQNGDTDLAENIDASLEAVEEILSTLLEISRLDSGGMKPDIGVFRLDEIMRQLDREFSPLAKSKGLKLIFVETSLAVRSDRKLLRRMLQNLIANAIKYTPSGRVLIGCRRKRNKLRIEVWDTGLGIPAAKQKLVFREFQRLDEGARQARGLGLGLSIVQRIGRVLDHPIRLASTPGRGSVFSIEITGTAHLPRSVPTVEETVPANAPLAGMHVLVIDNEPSILQGMRTLLGGWGCDVMTATSLATARETLRNASQRPDVLIADYQLDGDEDGIRVVNQLRWRVRRETPAILLTADRSDAVRDQAQERGMYVLHKPLKPAALRALLTQWRSLGKAAE